MEEIVIFLYSILLAAAIMDLKKGKISNWLILIGSSAGIFYQYISEATWILSIVTFLLLFPFFIIGALGAGDVKCICMIALYFSPNEFLISVLFGFLIAALYSVVILIKDFIIYQSRPFQRKHTIRLAVPIFLGVLISTGGTYL